MNHIINFNVCMYTCYVRISMDILILIISRVCEEYNTGNSCIFLESDMHKICIYKRLYYSFSSLFNSIFSYLKTYFFFFFFVYSIFSTISNTCNTLSHIGYLYSISFLKRKVSVDLCHK